MTPLEVSATVARLGGPSAVGRLVGRKPQTVCRWQRRGLDPRRPGNRRSIDRLRELLDNAPEPVTKKPKRKTCATCGQPDEQLVCEKCRAASIVFDRERGVGTVPLNLRRAYNLNDKGRPQRAA